jgi:hypothetical protein
MLLRHGLLLVSIIATSLIWSVRSQSGARATTLENVDWSKSETSILTLYRGAEIHDFTAPDFLKTVDLQDPGIIASSGIGVTVEPQQEKDMYFIARLPGRIGLICADHDWAGMTAEILVR